MSLPILDNGITIVVDGGCFNNQLPVDQRKMYGSFQLYIDGKKPKCVHFNGAAHAQGLVKWEYDSELWANTVPEVPPTNNVAECEMMLMAISYLYELAKRTTKQPLVRLVTDSTLVTGFVKGNKAKVKHLKPYREALREKYAGLPFQVSCEHASGEWVKSVLGH
jgi:ribonuclease HI